MWKVTLIWDIFALMNSDERILLVASFFRSFAVSSVSIFFGLYLAGLGLDETWIGFLISAGLFGMAVGTFIAAKAADRIGRRRMLLLLSLFMALGGVILSLSQSLPFLVAATFVGMINGMGRDRGPLQAIDQAILAQLTASQKRTGAFARYVFITDIGGAAGALVAGIPDSARSYRLALLAYAAVILAASLFYFFMSRSVEPTSPSFSRTVFSKKSRGFVYRFAALTTMDSLGGGFITRSLLTYWFVTRFDVDPFWIGPLFAGASAVNSMAYFVAAFLARRIGLLNTMVVTHIPSSVLLMLIPIAPDFTTAVVVFILREFLAPMDVPTRQSYLAAIVPEQERTAAAGVLNTVRNASWVVGPSAAGWSMTLSFSAPLYIAGVLKIIYDLSIWFTFRQIKPPEEQITASV